MLQWEKSQADEVLADAFGFHALQMGLPDLSALEANRMPHRWLALQGESPAFGTGTGMTEGFEADIALAESGQGYGAGAALHCEFDALPFPSQSLDLVVLPHALEFSRDPHLTLREVERVLVPEGRVLITGFNPASLWGLRHRRERRRLMAGATRSGLAVEQTPREPSLSMADHQVIGGPIGETISVPRLRDWLRLLSFELEGARFGCFRPPMEQARWLDRWAWVDRLGARWCPVVGGVYALLAVKRVRGMRLVGLARRQARYASAPRAVAVQRHHRQPPTT